jgi:hypothetical protein
VKATASGDGAVLNHLALDVARDDGSTQHADYTDGCLAVDDQKPSCLADNGMLTTLSLRPDELVWKVVDADGNHRVSLVGTFIGLGQRALDQFDGPKFLGAFGLEVYGDAAPIELDTPLKGTIDPAVGYAVYEFTAVDGTSYHAETGSDVCFAQVYREDGVGKWAADYTGATPGGRARVVVRCFDDSNVTAGGGDYEVTVKEGDGGFSVGPITVGTDGTDGTDGSSATSETLTADLSNGPVTVVLSGDYTVGSVIAITVTPDGAQDVSASSSDCAECGTVNDSPGGMSEFLFIDVTETSTHEVTITPVSPADATGTVTIEVYGS